MVIDEFFDQRKLMIETQLKRRGIKDKKVLDAILKVPRHKFVPDNLINSAYDDCPLPIGNGQTISQPYMVAIMTELLKLDKDKIVLEIGTGSGYQTAILAEISKEVYTIERVPELSKKAQKILKELGYDNIFFKIGDGTKGWFEFSPYDAILVTAGAPHIPKTLIKQLKENGIIVIPVGGSHTQVLTVGIKKDRELITNEHFFCAFVPLIGEEGWKD